MSVLKQGTLAAVVMAALAGCYVDRSMLSSPPAPTVSHVPNGTDFTVRLHEPVGTFSMAGQKFTAETRTPLYTNTGEILVPVGSLVRGHVVGVDQRGPLPRVRISFDSILTTRGPVPLEVSVRDASRYADPTVENVDPVMAGYDAALYPLQISSPGVPGPLPPAYQGYVEPSREIRVPAGANLKLELRRPLQ